MKLVEILAKELKHWPVGCDKAVCDTDGEIRMLNTNCRYDFYPTLSVDESERVNGFALLGAGGAVVTRQMWEAEKAKLNAQNTSVFAPIYCRDRIKEIDSLVESLEEERVSLVQALEDEGFALIEKINKQFEECKQSYEDMSDWRNWRRGDFLECVEDIEDVYTKGQLYTFIEMSEWGSARCMDDCSEENGLPPNLFKFHSRPQ